METAITVFGIAWRFAVGAATVVAIVFVILTIASVLEQLRIERKRKAQWEARRAALQRSEERAKLRVVRQPKPTAIEEAEYRITIALPAPAGDQERIH